MKLGVIGCGLMASAIMEGIVSKGLLTPEDILAADKFEASRERAQANLGVHITADNREAAAQDVVLLALHPNFCGAVLDEIADVVREHGTVVWSIAAGVTVDQICSHVGEDAKVVRCMPNTCATVGTAVTGVVPNANVSEEEVAALMELIGGFGIAERFDDERKLDAIIPVTGSSPAMIFMLIDAMANGAAREGFTWEQAVRFSAQAVKGAAEMVLVSGKHPAQLQNQVCTPGGITIEMVKRLEAYGFRNAVLEAMQACTEDL